MMCSTQTQPETARFTSHSLARAPPWLVNRSFLWTIFLQQQVLIIFETTLGLPWKFIRNLLEFWLPKMDSMILHQFHVPRNCPALEMVIPRQDAKTRGLDTFEVYLGATVLAFNRKLSSPWLKCNKKPNKFYSTLPRMLSFDTWYPSWPRWWGKGYGTLCTHTANQP